MTLSIDFETRSTVDLTKTGVYRYAEDPTTDIVCMAYAFGDEDVRVWVPGDDRPAWFDAHVKAGGELRAHNAQFERIMWREILGPRYGFPVPTLEQWHCTAAEAAAMALPRSLGQVSKVLNVDTPKDDAGHRLMRQMCKPRKIEEDGTTIWWEDAERMRRLIDYCKTDVLAERAVAKRVRRLSPREREVYLLDQRINDRGIRLDVPLIEAASAVVEQGLAEANRELRAATNGEVTSVTKVADLTRWLQEQGIAVEDVRKSTVRDLLSDPADLPLAVEQALTLRQEAGKSSTAKLKTMLTAKCADDRVRGLLLYHGASTGRWSGKLIQPQNFPRGTVKDAEGYIPLILDGQDAAHWQDPPLAVVSSLLRGMLIASPGHRLIAGDFSQIEARILGWFADEPFRDLEYERMAAAIYRVPLERVTPEMRHVGKGVVLGCGYQMWWPKYQAQMAEQSGIQLDDETAEAAVTTYRSMKPGIPTLWYSTEYAAMEAVKKPGEVQHCGVNGSVRYVVRGQFLWCILPSGRPLAYALPKVEMVTRTFIEVDEDGEEVKRTSRKLALTFMGVNSVTRKWGRTATYGGHLVENIVQATARDVMAEAMLRLEGAGYPAVLTVHDEVVCDVPEGHGSLDEFLMIMRKVPSWLPGCSLEAEGWAGERYRK
jgi:DNA polymerase bacteriophage-type